jgi:CheY-like chemotaxis protein
LSEIGILIIDDDIVSQRALKNILDSEGWRVRIVPLAAHALSELAVGGWSLVIVNMTPAELRGPIFAILRELALANEPETIETVPANERRAGSDETSQNPQSGSRLRVLFLVPALAARDLQPLLEREGLPYILKPYHLHDFLEKVSELLLESGAIEAPIRSARGFGGSLKRSRSRRSARDSRRGAMFASREDYQMTEEELVEWERQEEEERKKRAKEQKDREHVG